MEVSGEDGDESGEGEVRVERVEVSGEGGGGSGEGGGEWGGWR